MCTALAEDDESKSLNLKLQHCYANISHNVQLLEESHSQNKKIPLTLADTVFELLFHAFVGYLEKDALSYVWDCLFLFEWDLLRDITIRILSSPDLLTRMEEDQIDDAVALWRLLRAYLSQLSVHDLKRILCLK